MKTRILFALGTVVGVAAIPALAQNSIASWGDGTPGTHFNIDDLRRTIVVLRGDGLNYKFYAQDAARPDNLGVINNISVAAGATGDFTLLIDQPTAGQRGAFRWSAGDLRYPGGTCTIVGIDLGRIVGGDGACGTQRAV